MSPKKSEEENAKKCKDTSNIDASKDTSTSDKPKDDYDANVHCKYIRCKNYTF